MKTVQIGIMKKIISPYNKENCKGYHYDLTLDNEFVKYNHYKKESTPIPVSDGEEFELRPGDFVLAQTKEKVDVPNDILGMLFGTSSWARTGLLMQTGLIHAGFHGRITLEFSNPTNFIISLSPGDKIAQILFCYINNIGGIDSKYMGQGIPSPAK